MKGIAKSKKLVALLVFTICLGAVATVELPQGEVHAQNTFKVESLPISTSDIVAYKAVGADLTDFQGKVAVSQQLAIDNIADWIHNFKGSAVSVQLKNVSERFRHLPSQIASSDANISNGQFVDVPTYIIKISGTIPVPAGPYIPGKKYTSGHLDHYMYIFEDATNGQILDAFSYGDN